MCETRGGKRRSRNHRRARSFFLSLFLSFLRARALSLLAIFPSRRRVGTVRTRARRSSFSFHTGQLAFPLTVTARPPVVSSRYATTDDNDERMRFFFYAREAPFRRRRDSAPPVPFLARARTSITINIARRGGRGELIKPRLTAAVFRSRGKPARVPLLREFLRNLLSRISGAAIKQRAARASPRCFVLSFSIFFIFFFYFVIIFSIAPWKEFGKISLSPRYY